MVMSYQPKRKEGQVEKNPIKYAVKEFKLDGVTIGVFAGDRGANPDYDILIKYQKEGKRTRTPKHIHWVVDVLIKKEHNKELTLKFLKYLFEMYDKVKGFQNKADRDNCTLTETTKAKLKPFEELNRYGEYSVEFIGHLIELMIKMEKNHPNPHVFKELMEALLNEEDIFVVVGRATQIG